MKTDLQKIINDAIKKYPEIFDEEILKELKVEELPEPSLWKILVLPAMPKRKMGSIILTDDVQEAERYNNSRSLVLSLGPLAYRDTARFKEHPEASCTLSACQPGDFVCHGKYSGQRLQVSGVDVMLLNDDEITAKIPNPAALTAYI